MKKFKVYFELYGKKMRSSIMAIDESDAKNKIANKIVFHKIEREPSNIFEEMDAAEDIFKSIFGKGFNNL